METTVGYTEPGGCASIEQIGEAVAVAHQDDVALHKRSLFDV